MKSSIAVIIPTYNAKHTILELISEILVIKNTLIIVVDDNSPDNTALLVKKHFADNKRVNLVVRQQKGGRGSAVIRGFKEALKDKNIQYFVEMDADLCHNPKYIPLLIEKCKYSDVAIASKYANGSVIFGLPKKRLYISKLVNIVIKALFRIPISDITNGFRCYKRNLLQQIPLNKIQSRGFIVLTELAFYIHKQGGVFAEIPFVFKQYNLTRSNLNMREAIEAGYTILRLKLQNF